MYIYIIRLLKKNGTNGTDLSHNITDNQRLFIFVPKQWNFMAHQLEQVRFFFVNNRKDRYK